MSSKAFSSNRKAEMGVGTLIIFIALLLVAAIAAGVLIQTAGSLQQKALATGQQATGQVSTHASVLEVSATDGDNTMNNFSIIMKLAPGSDPIKLNDVLVSFNTVNDTATLVYNGTSGAQPTIDSNNENGTFTVEWIQQGSDWENDKLQRGDVVRLFLLAPRHIAEDEEIRMDFIPKTGTTTGIQFVTPEVITTKRVYLYP